MGSGQKILTRLTRDDIIYLLLVHFCVVVADNHDSTEEVERR